ncbi:MAG: hypothetical protein AAFQ16_11950 [Pseudomonadota bacterium]
MSALNILASNGGVLLLENGMVELLRSQDVPEPIRRKARMFLHFIDPHADVSDDLQDFFDVYRIMTPSQRDLVEEFARRVLAGTAPTLGDQADDNIGQPNAIYPELPKAPPELYRNRPKLPKVPRENIVSFVERVYGPWLGAPGFSMAYVTKVLDEDAGAALYRHSKRYGLPAHFHMTTKPIRSNRRHIS